MTIFLLRTRFTLILPLFLLVVSCGEQPDVHPDESFTFVKVAEYPTSTTPLSILKNTLINSNLPLDLDRPSASYLEEVIPPCTSEDACLAQTPPSVRMLSVRVAPPYWPYSNSIPTFEQILLREGDYVGFAPHIVIRGMVLQDTTRCAPYPSIPHNYKRISAIDGLYHYHCFADVAISEYIVGNGPPVLTISLHRENLWGIDLSNWDNIKDKTIQHLDNPEYRTANAYEGKEVILFLDLPYTIMVESWAAMGNFKVWYVQKTETNGTRAVAQDIMYARTDEQRSRLSIPLDELTQRVKEAAATRTEITGGRIGRESYLPMLITDANRLQAFYISEGAVYNNSDKSTVLPPPIPGEGDPVPVTVPIGEETTETSVPVPGEETTVPPSTDDAGLTVGQDTTTTTGVTTTTEATTTTETETPVTTESTPTVTTTVEAPETTTTTEATTTTTTTTTEVETPVTTESTPTVTATAEVPETTTTTTEPAPAETVTGTTTTTTTPVEEPNGEEVVPATDEPPEPGEETEGTTSLTTTTTATPVDGDGTPGAETTTTILTGDDGTAPADDGNGDEAQPSTTIPVSE